jgi:hypothetical protein
VRPLDRCSKVCAGTLLVALLGACASDPDDGRFRRHFEAPIIGESLQEQWQRPDRAIPELTLLATVPVAFMLDSDLHEDTPQEPISVGGKTAGDTIPIALGAGALAVGGFDWVGGDRAQTFEAASEALALTALTTETLKNAVGRRRPDRGTPTSFPSGHTSFSFAATTVLLRELEGDDGDSAWNPWEIAAYVPAGYVAWERVRADRHWPSDVAAGAFFGVFISNWVWDAHFPHDGERRIYEAPSKVSWHLEAVDLDGRAALGVTIWF